MNTEEQDDEEETPMGPRDIGGDSESPIVIIDTAGPYPEIGQIPLSE